MASDWKKWQDVWPGLCDQIDALVLVAFRMLVCQLDEGRFFLKPPDLIDEVRRQAKPPAELTTLLRTHDSMHTAAFARLVHDRLVACDDASLAELAFAVDLEIGPVLSEHLRSGDRTRQQAVAQAVNAANRALMQLGPERPVILVRSPQQFWSRKKKVVPMFSLGTPSKFKHLLPVLTKLSRVDYSVLGGGGKRKLTVALWPAAAPPITSRALTRRKINKVTVLFRFKSWDDLLKKLQAQQMSLAARIADYVSNARDVMDAVYIVAAPELMLAPQSHGTVNAAVASRRNAAWIVFPGSYHIDHGEEVINQASIRIGGILDKRDLTTAPSGGAVSAVKHNSFATDYKGVCYREEISGEFSSVHLLDTCVGRIAVMICLDFLDDNRRAEVVSMGIDHLFVLSMSPDSGSKFKIAMDAASNYQTASFFVNAFTGSSRPAGYRKPLKKARVIWRRACVAGQPCVFVLED
jgi:hypothetical protein